MARPRLCRRISSLPNVTYFKPRGIPLRDLDEVCISVDELEALRLHDVKGIEQIECGRKMNISQPTFHRILAESRKKVAEALTQGKAIRIEGGDFEMTTMRQFLCNNCEHTWEVPFGTGQRGIDMDCPKCQSSNIHRIDQGGQGFGNRPWGRKQCALRQEANKTG